MSEVYWLSQAFDMIKRYVACVQAAFADPHLVRFEMTTNFGCALNAESIRFDGVGSIPEEDASRQRQIRFIKTEA